MISLIARGSDVDETNRALLTDCVLVGIPKPKTTKLRPLAMGEALLKLAGSIAVSGSLEALQEKFASLQYGLKKAGTEEIINEARAYINDPSNSEHCIVTIDCENAFNSIFRTCISEAVRDPAFRNLAPLFDLCYSRPSRLLVRNPDMCWTIIPSTQGGRQGDSCMPAFFCLGIHSILQAIADRHNIVIKAYLDDITIYGGVASCTEATLEIEQMLKDIGLIINRTKSHVYGTNYWLSTSAPEGSKSWEHG